LYAKYVYYAHAVTKVTDNFNKTFQVEKIVMLNAQCDILSPA